MSEDKYEVFEDANEVYLVHDIHYIVCTSCFDVVKSNE